MPSFGWLGIFRQGQWQAFRRFVLEERRDVDKRIAMIEAERARIGEVTVHYASTEDEGGNTVKTEQRVGFEVSAGSSLEKLFRAYTAMGGNPFDVSMFLTPDSIVYLEDEDRTIELQPYGGVIYPKSGVYVAGGIYEGGFLVANKYYWERMGGRKEPEDSRTVQVVNLMRRWTQQEIREKRTNIETRIIKLCDLREQLTEELDMLTMALAGQVGAIPSADTDVYGENLGVAQLVSGMDRVFYELDDEGHPDFSTTNLEELTAYENLLEDIEFEEDNTAL